jgi:predicted  nucleic acid-binding Zn-ribbon protein
VHEALRRLVDLQRVDETRHRLELELAAIPARRSGFDARESEARDHAARARAALDAAQLELRRAEATLRDQEASKQRLDGQQSQVKSNTAYTALLHEIDAATATISETETRILELMDAVQAARKEAEDAERGLAASEEALRAERQALEIRAEELGKERARAEGERTGCAWAAGWASLLSARWRSSRARTSSPADPASGSWSCRRSSRTAWVRRRAEAFRNAPFRQGRGPQAAPADAEKPSWNAGLSGRPEGMRGGWTGLDGEQKTQ